MRFRVTNQYAKGSEDVLAEFKNQTDAEHFINLKLNQDNLLKIKVLYHLYDSFDLVKTYDAADADTAEESSTTSSQTTARPTPFNTTPTPAGTPKKWWTNEDEEDK